MAGYSGTPLAKKLGIKDGHVVALVQAPPGMTGQLEPLPDDVALKRDLRGRGLLDVMLFFTKNASELKRRFKPLAGRLQKNGGLWVCWPKKTSGVVTDVTEALVRETGLGAGLVDNKICAVDETWSGLRFVYRLRDR